MAGRARCGSRGWGGRPDWIKRRCFCGRGRSEGERSLESAFCSEGLDAADPVGRVPLVRPLATAATLNEPAHPEPDEWFRGYERAMSEVRLNIGLEKWS